MAVSLWNKSHYSFLEGASSPEELVDAAADAGHTHIALTDRSSFYGLVKAHVRAKYRGIVLIPGVELGVEEHSRVVLLALDSCAYIALCEAISEGQLLAKKKGEANLKVNSLNNFLIKNPGLICLCPSYRLLCQLRKSEGHNNLFALVAREFSQYQVEQERDLVSVAKELDLPCVAALEVLYHAKPRRVLQDVLTCIRYNTTLDCAIDKLKKNAECAYPKRGHLEQIFKDQPEWLKNADDIATKANFSLDMLRYRYPSGQLADGETVEIALKKRVEKGALERLGEDAKSPKVMAQLKYEMEVVSALDYGGYFLSMEEIVHFCRQKNILCQGRGSAANSLICFCLGITAVNPLPMALLFERFISQARCEPPDIDLDIEHHRREEVIQWVYQKYGRSHAAMVSNVVRFRWRSAIRQVGKVLGFPSDLIERLAKTVGMTQGPDSEGFAEEIDFSQKIAAAGIAADYPRLGHFLRLTAMILDVPRHLSVHPGGFVLGQKPIRQLCPVEPATMAGRTTVPWDKHDVASLGLFKVDLLGLGALTHVQKTFELIRHLDDIHLCMATVPQEDAKTYAMLSEGDSIGVFQVESRAQMTMLPRLQPKTFYDLVVEVAIVRPGPIQGDMVHPYLRQRQRGVQPCYPHPAFKEILAKTWGVPIFQEQVMKLAIMAADYAPEEADLLRRDMAAWRSHNKLEGHHRRIVAGMMQKGVPKEFAERMFNQIRGFGEYGFPESHAASFAHIVYVTAYLRRHFLAAFVCALLNSQPMGFYSPNTIIEDAKRHGVDVRPIEINKSDFDCTLEEDMQGIGGIAQNAVRRRWAVRIGLKYIKGFGDIQRKKLSSDKKPFYSIADVARRSELCQRDMLALVRAGALENLPGNNHCLESRPVQLWHTTGWQQTRSDTLLQPAHQGQEKLPRRLGEDFGENEAVCWDLAATHHSTRGHPLAGLRRQLRKRGYADAKQISQLPSNAKITIVGWVVCRQRPQTARGTLFLTLEDEFGLSNIVLWPHIVDLFYRDIVGQSVLGIRGVVQRQHKVIHVIGSEVFPWPNRATQRLQS